MCGRPLREGRYAARKLQRESMRNNDEEGNSRASLI